MIRSLFAIVLAVILGLTTARFVEGAGLALAGEARQTAPAQAAGDDGRNADARVAGRAHFAALVAGWGAGAFAAALCALLIAGRWAPLGALAAGSIFLAALVAQVEAGLGWTVWIAAAPATALGGYAAIRLTGAGATHPANRRKDGLFDD